ncbi:MAG: peptidase P60 [Pseudomonadota bacterium]
MSNPSSSPAEDETVAKILRLARGWIGTPYCHQASCRGAGADCLGLIRGVWREHFGGEPETPPAYTPDWGEARGEDLLLGAALRHMTYVTDPHPGDVLLFRMLERGPAKHLAVFSGICPIAGRRMIHAYSGHAVCETSLGAAWMRRLAGAFRFPRIPS